MARTKKFGVLFVCTGNICRSPTAEAVFRHFAVKSGAIEFLNIDSAGTHGYHVGEPPDHRAVAACLSRGIDMRDLRARKFSGRDHDNFDLILAMDSGHYNIIRQSAKKGGKAELAMFMDFVPDAAGTDVPDPYYGSEQAFEHAFAMIERGAQGLLAHIEDRFIEDRFKHQ